MTVEDAVAVTKRVQASGLRQVRLLGGEPTQHASFARILDAVVSRGVEALVFSNGLMSDEAIGAILRTPAEACRVMLNLNVGAAELECETSWIARTAARLGGRAFAGVNIHAPGLPLRKAVDFAETHGLSRVLRVGLAHPRLDRRNRSLHPRHYPQVGEELEELFAEIAPRGFAFSFDCGFVPCMFSAGFLGQAGVPVHDLGRRCGAIPDVLPDLTAIHCFPLRELDQLPLAGVATVQAMRALLEARAACLGGIGIYRACAACRLRQDGDCLGGCLSAAMGRAHRRSLADAKESGIGVAVRKPARARAPAPESETRTWAIPFIDQPATFWQALAAEFGGAIREVYFPIAIEGIGTGRPARPHAHADAFLRAGALSLAVLVNPLVLPQPLEDLGGRIVDELARLHEEYGVAAATLADVRLARRVRRRLPAMRLTASCLLEVCEPGQLAGLDGVFDVLVPSTRLTRRPDRLAALRAAFPGRLRLLVNEGCLDSCLDRKQHFHEMAGAARTPQSLCADRLARNPWLRFTGAWVLPQHLDLLDACVDEFKLAGRSTLDEPETYLRVLRAYISRKALWSHAIGGGPASMTAPASVPLSHFQWMTQCDHVCADCAICRRAAAGQWPSEAPA